MLFLSIYCRTPAKGTRVKTAETQLEKSVLFETIDDLVIPAGCLGDEKDADGKYLYTVKIRQGTTIYEDYLGSSNGLANQEFKLGYKMCIPSTLQLFVNEGGGYVQWEQVKNFIDSDKDDRHYTVTVNDADETFIQFGDNFSGKIPEEYLSGILATYCVGGGSLGNVVPLAINQLDFGIAGIAKTFNPYGEYVPGVEKETLKEIKNNAPAYLRTLWRAVTLQDHADLLKINFSQVRFAHAIHDPYDRNNALVFVLLENNAPFTLEFKQELIQFYSKRKMVGNSVYVYPPEWYKLKLEAQLWIRDDFNRKDVEAQVRQVVADYFKIGEYDFDTELVLPVFEAIIIESIRGVRSFRITYPLKDIIKPKPQEIIVLDELTLNVFGGVG